MMVSYYNSCYNPEYIRSIISTKKTRQSHLKVLNWHPGLETKTRMRIIEFDAGSSNDSWCNSRSICRYLGYAGEVKRQDDSEKQMHTSIRSSIRFILIRFIKKFTKKHILLCPTSHLMALPHGYEHW